MCGGLGTEFVVWGSWYRVGVESIYSVYGVLIVCILGGSVDLDGLIDRVIVPRTTADRGPHRLVVRTSRRGRDNPGSTPGEDICRHTYIHVKICSCARMYKS